MILKNRRVQEAINQALVFCSIPDDVKGTSQEAVVLYVLEYIALFYFDLPTTRILYRHLLRHKVQEVAQAYAASTDFPLGFFTTTTEF